MQFDLTSLRRIVGSEGLSRLAPVLRDQVPVESSAYDRCAGMLDDASAAILLHLLSPLAEGFEERPIDYIKSFRLLDGDGRTLLRGGDHNNFLLFDLPAAERAALPEAYRASGVPEGGDRAGRRECRYA